MLLLDASRTARDCLFLAKLLVRCRQCRIRDEGGAEPARVVCDVRPRSEEPHQARSRKHFRFRMAKRRALLWIVLF
jgi:hypothetical protein